MHPCHYASYLNFHVEASLIIAFDLYPCCVGRWVTCWSHGFAGLGAVHSVQIRSWLNEERSSKKRHIPGHSLFCCCLLLWFFLISVNYFCCCCCGCVVGRTARPDFLSILRQFNQTWFGSEVWSAKGCVTRGEGGATMTEIRTWGCDFLSNKLHQQQAKDPLTISWVFNKTSAVHHWGSKFLWTPYIYIAILQ